MTLLFDMPLEALREYQGRNPRPSDFDAFWADGLAEMQAIDPQVELVADDFQTSFADCFPLYFTGVGGARIHAKLVRRKHVTGPHPAILQFHGYRVRFSFGAVIARSAVCDEAIRAWTRDCFAKNARNDSVPPTRNAPCRNSAKGT